ncbi:unnamed protein product [Zymoseptoria tritici ST99CH_3D1]|nr:unnamed protein product [Zymoseptoria tritici ST99CH_3D1]
MLHSLHLDVMTMPGQVASREPSILDVSSTRNAFTVTAPSRVVKQFQDNLQPRLQAMLPVSAMYDGADLTVAELTRYHVKWLIYAMTNNMAGSGRDAPTSQTIYRYLKDSVMILLSGKPVASPLRRMLLSMPSIKLMAEAFLRSALEVGDSRAVETLLQFPDLGIRVNDLSIAVNGRTYTAVERATLLQHLQMTMLLVAHGADVDKTYRKPSGSTRLRHCSQATEHSYNLCSMMGAAANAIQGHDRSSTLGYSLVDSLLRHGAGVDPLALAKVITTKDIAMIEILLHGGLQHQLFEWTQARFLHAAFFALPPASLVKVIVQLQLYGFDFTEARYDCAPHIRWYYQTKDLPPRLIDVVALRGEREIVCMLLSHGSPITPDTVVAAVLSGNADLVEFLLRQKQFANAFSNHFYTTPLAEAVRSQHPILLPMLVGLVELHHIEPNPGIALLAAATEAGDIGLLRKLLSCHCPFSAVRSRKPLWLTRPNLLQCYWRQAPRWTSNGFTHSTRVFSISANDLQAHFSAQVFRRR